MSETASVDHEEQLAHIARMREETQKLSEETRKYVAEAHKLSAETRKLSRDAILAHWQIVVTAMTAGAALFGAGAAFIKLLGT